jgi:subtilase family serine protease
MKKYFVVFLAVILFLVAAQNALAAYHFSNYKGKNPIHIFKSDTKIPQGISPDQIKNIYNLPKIGGHGTIAIIDAYNDKTMESDLAIFNKAFNLADCSTKNKCFEQHLMSSGTATNSGWAGETALDVEWAHAIAPDAKILLVEAKTPSGANLLGAIDYAASRSDVVAVSMSWGGDETIEEKSLDLHFASKSGAVFFASSGDDGWGASWPAASPNVVSVGGTSLLFKSDGTLNKETAWSGSGGGVSAYETQPDFQKNYSIPKANGMRAIPDVSYDADPQSGFSTYSNGKWYVVGGTSDAAPQWAAIQSLGLSATDKNLYSDKSSATYSKYFRDIVSGKNGDCKYYCQAAKHYDYVTGLGSPVTVNF